jgi:hypothetical protein
MSSICIHIIYSESSVSCWLIFEHKKHFFGGLTDVVSPLPFSSFLFTGKAGFNRDSIINFHIVHLWAEEPAAVHH